VDLIDQRVHATAEVVERHHRGAVDGHETTAVQRWSCRVVMISAADAPRERAARQDPAERLNEEGQAVALVTGSHD
jgi:hypothetical protein